MMAHHPPLISNSNNPLCAYTITMMNVAPDWALDAISNQYVDI